MPQQTLYDAVIDEILSMLVRERKEAKSLKPKSPFELANIRLRQQACEDRTKELVESLLFDIQRCGADGEKVHEKLLWSKPKPLGLAPLDVWDWSLAEIEAKISLLEGEKDRLTKERQNEVTGPVTEGQEQRAMFNFYKSGDAWMIGEGGKEPTPLNHLVGLAQIHFLVKNQGTQYGHDTLYRKSGGTAKGEEVDPTTVSKGIRSALEKIARMPELEPLRKYLDMDRLKTGKPGKYKYTPDPAKPVTWNLDPPA